MISFVVPAFNEERLLPATLEAIHVAGQATGTDYEVIVVDDESSDGTADLAAAAGARVVHVRHRQIAATRNAGAREAKGQLLVFVDADTFVPARTVQAAAAAVQSGAIGGGARVVFEGSVPFYARVLLPVILWIFRIRRFAAGCFVFCTRDAFRATGGFDESLFASEEIGFSRALGRIGDFVILREHVITSGRKLRAHSTLSMFRTMTQIVMGGRKVLRDRDKLALWYGERSDDENAGS